MSQEPRNAMSSFALALAVGCIALGCASGPPLHTDSSNTSAVDYFEADAQVAFAKLGPIQAEARGMVITLPGRLLFAPNLAELAPAGRLRLDDVVTVLLATRQHNLTIAGHADAEGIDTNSVDLSARRVNVVRDYIAEHNYRPTLVQSTGAAGGHLSIEGANLEGLPSHHDIDIIVSRD